MLLVTTLPVTYNNPFIGNLKAVQGLDDARSLIYCTKCQVISD